MREIKFRAWNGGMMRFMDDGEILLNHQGLLAPDEMYTEWTPREWPLMQYTGMKDNNGKEIYEGDILKNRNILYPVVWDQDRFGFSIRGKDPVFLNTPAFSSASQVKREAEVIGNIYENPELLGEHPSKSGSQIIGGSQPIVNPGHFNT